VVAVIIAALFALFGQLSFARFVQIFIACVIIGGAEILVRTGILLGQGG
jgi:type IV secretory pathway VirB2 component (pilin)